MDRQKRLRKEAVPGLLKARNRLWVLLGLSVYGFAVPSLAPESDVLVFVGVICILPIIFLLIELPIVFVRIERARRGEMPLNRDNILEQLLPE